MDGWIKLYRKLLDSSDWQLSTPEQKCVMVSILLLASHREKQWEWTGKKFMVTPGQFITSIDSLSKACGLGVSRQNVRTALKRFEKLGFLTNQSTKTGRLIKVTNWHTYQPKESQPNIEANRHLTDSQHRPNLDLTPIKNVKKEKNIKKTTYTSDFEKFWLAYPKKIGKGAAFQSWLKIKPSNGTRELILAAVAKQCQCEQWCKDSGQFIPNPATWLNQCRWDDDTSTTVKSDFNKRFENYKKYEG